MHRIVSSITSLAHHVDAVGKTPDLYRPQTCPHCGMTRLWRHGCYFRKTDRELKGNASRNPVAILRYCCAACWRTCSRLPLCIAPRRWYDWALQQAVLLLLLSGESLRHCSRSLHLDRHTVRRWRDWLQSRTDTFAFFLRSRFPELGRSGEGSSAFWRTVLDRLSLATAMAWLDRELIVP